VLPRAMATFVARNLLYVARSIAIGMSKA